MSVRGAALRFATLSALVCGSVTSAAQPLAVEPGMPVNDLAGGSVGTVVALGDGEITVRTDRYDVRIPTTSTVVSKVGVLIAMTRTELNAAVDRSQTASPTMSASAAQADAVAVATLSN